MMETEIAETGNSKLLQTLCEFNHVNLNCRTGNAGGFNFWCT